MILDRRNFLKSVGIIGSFGVVSCNNMAPEEQLTAYLSPPAEMIPGIASYYATVCRACPAGCGIWVKTRERRPIKLEGNPVHPVNKGALCIRGQAFIQDLYSAKRARTPLVRKNGKLEEASWKEAINVVSKQLQATPSVGFITGLESGTYNKLIADFLDEFGKSKHVMFEPFSGASSKAASNLVFGKNEVPRINLENSDLVVSLGADFLDTWSSPVELSRQWADRHGVEQGRQLEMDYFGPRRNLTGTSADRFYKLSASDVDSLALTLLHKVYSYKRLSLKESDAASVNRMIGMLGKAPSNSPVPKKALDELLARLTKAKSAVVLFGGADVLGEQSTAVHAAVLLTNVLLGAVGKSIQYGQELAASKASSDVEVIDLVRAASAGSPGVLFIQDANLISSLPAQLKAEEHLSKAKFKVALAHSLNETTELADVVLPIHHPLESWGDYAVTKDIIGLMQPVRAPLYDTRHVGDLLLDLAKHTGRGLGSSNYKDYLVGKFAKALHPAATITQDPTDAGVPEDPTVPEMSDQQWEQMLVDGGRFQTIESTGEKPSLLPATRLPTIRPAESSGESDVALVTPITASLYDGRNDSLNWLLETPDPITQTAWEIPIEVSKDLAVKAGIKDGDRVKLKNNISEVEGTAIVENGLVASTVALRHGNTEQANLLGSAVNLLSGKFDPISGELVRAGTKVSISRVSSGELVSVMGSPDSKGRLLALSMGLDDLEQKHFPIMTRHGEVHADDAHHGEPKPVPMPHEEKGGTRPADNMYSLQEHTKHRWGLVIDLDRCTGCSACVAACYAENNIPIVGKKEVALGRELSWIRIEKHVFGEGDNERVQFLPVMCQQCDNAPCETVCPVFAASHTTDGLNAQIYNRCIGTRYCSNNCPYKVRRFNYFDYKREKPGNQQLNPDVTVRSRGVMEKCTFCIQRIREVQNRRKVEGRELVDGEILPACAQTCPTGAISFGDFKRQDWIMSKAARDPRGYRLLDYMVNTRPGVVYLRKVNTVTQDEDV